MDDWFLALLNDRFFSLTYEMDLNFSMDTEPQWMQSFMAAQGAENNWWWVLSPNKMLKKKEDSWKIRKRAVKRCCLLAVTQPLLTVCVFPCVRSSRLHLSPANSGCSSEGASLCWTAVYSLMLREGRPVTHLYTCSWVEPDSDTLMGSCKPEVA